MKKKSLSIFFFLLAAAAFGQQAEKEVFAFPITDYINSDNDSISIIQVHIPAPLVQIQNKQPGLLKHNFTNNKEDTSTIGYGRCGLIKSNYYYFSIRLNKTMVKPVQNDILYTKIIYPAKHRGQLVKLIQIAVYFERVTGGKFYTFETGLELNETSEKDIIDLMVSDIKYTGLEMQKKSDDQDMTIKGGLFDGKKLFATMQIITAENVKDFIDYVIARPAKYAGNTWKISETFATWATSETPKVIK